MECTHASDLPLHVHNGTEAIGFIPLTTCGDQVWSILSAFVLFHRCDQSRGSNSDEGWMDQTWSTTWVQFKVWPSFLPFEWIQLSVAPTQHLIFPKTHCLRLINHGNDHLKTEDSNSTFRCSNYILFTTQHEKCVLLSAMFSILGLQPWHQKVARNWIP